MSSLKAQITEDMKSCMRAGEKDRLGTIRLLLAAIKQREVDERIELTDADILNIITKMLKQRKDSISQFETANRQDLVDVEKKEVEHLKPYMPEALSESEIQALLDAAIKQAGAEGMKDMGKVMGILKPQLQGRADMGQVSQLIKSRLA